MPTTDIQPPAGWKVAGSTVTQSTRGRLIDAAACLFAEQGIDAPSLREINEKAGQRNASALQYHFKNRDALVHSVLERYGTSVRDQRHSMLDRLPLDQRTLRQLVSCMVQPLSVLLEDSEGGSHYLQVSSEVMARPRRFAPILQDLVLPDMRRWSKEVESFVPLEALGPPLHRRFAVVRFVHSEMAIRARVPHHRGHALFTNHLIDVGAAMLTAPVSDSTKENLILDETRQAN